MTNLESIAVVNPALSALDLKALRQADAVSFHYHNEQATIVATKRVKDHGPFDDRERKHEFNVNASFSGRINGEFVNRDTVKCFEMIQCAPFSERWQTIVSLLRIGDELTLDWHADGKMNGYLEHAIVNEGHGAGERLHADALWLRIKRGDKRFVFLLEVRICPNNSARMMRS